MNPSAGIRYYIYVVAVFVNATVVAAQTQVDLPWYVVSVVAGFNAVVAVIAGHNVTPDEEV